MTYLGLWLLAILGSPEGVEVSVPTIKAPQIDNIVSADEWHGATEVEIEGGGRLLVGIHDGVLYLAVDRMPGAKFAFGCLFAAVGDRIWVFHASAQLGSAHYRLQDQVWNPEKTSYAWKKAERMWSEEHWRAGVNPEGTQEFAVARDLLGATPLIAFGYWMVKDKKQQALGWPQTARDGTRDLQLLSGHNPAGLTFTPATWARLQFP